MGCDWGRPSSRKRVIILLLMASHLAASFRILSGAGTSLASAASRRCTTYAHLRGSSRRHRTLTLRGATSMSSPSLAVPADNTGGSGGLSGAPFASHTDFCAALSALRGDPLECEGGRIVIFRGNAKAKLMVVGEAPGETEDLQGLPFVGRAGQLLDRILESVSFEPQRDCYISNIVRRRPPNNRNPLAPEVTYYRPWLLEEIRLVDPYIILLAGSFSMKALLEGEKLGITKVRGQWYERALAGSSGEGGIDGEGTRLLMPIFHPSYLLRNPSRVVGGPKSLTWQDMQEVRRKYDELVVPDAD